MATNNDSLAASSDPPVKSQMKLNLVKEVIDQVDDSFIVVDINKSKTFSTSSESIEKIELDDECESKCSDRFLSETSSLNENSNVNEDSGFYPNFCMVSNDSSANPMEQNYDSVKEMQIQFRKAVEDLQAKFTEQVTLLENSNFNKKGCVCETQINSVYETVENKMPQNLFDETRSTEEVKNNIDPVDASSKVANIWTEDEHVYETFDFTNCSKNNENFKKSDDFSEKIQQNSYRYLDDNVMAQDGNIDIPEEELILDKALEKHSEAVYENALPTVTVNICSSTSHCDFKNLCPDYKYKENVDIFNEMSDTIGPCFEKIDFHLINTQKALKEVLRVMDAFEELNHFNSAHANIVISLKKELAVYRKKLVMDLVETLVNKEKFFKSVRNFDKIWKNMLIMERELGIQKSNNELLKNNKKELTERLSNLGKEFDTYKKFNERSSINEEEMIRRVINAKSELATQKEANLSLQCQFAEKMNYIKELHEKILCLEKEKETVYLEKTQGQYQNPCQEDERIQLSNEVERLQYEKDKLIAKNFSLDYQNKQILKESEDLRTQIQVLEGRNEYYIQQNTIQETQKQTMMNYHVQYLQEKKWFQEEIERGHKIISDYKLENEHLKLKNIQLKEDLLLFTKENGEQRIDNSELSKSSEHQNNENEKETELSLCSKCSSEDLIYCHCRSKLHLRLAPQ